MTMTTSRHPEPSVPALTDSTGFAHDVVGRISNGDFPVHHALDTALERFQQTAAPLAAQLVEWPDFVRIMGLLEEQFLGTAIEHHGRGVALGTTVEQMRQTLLASAGTPRGSTG